VEEDESAGPGQAEEAAWKTPTAMACAAHCVEDETQGAAFAEHCLAWFLF